MPKRNKGKGRGGNNNAGPPAALKRRGRMHRMRNSDQVFYDQLVEEGLEKSEKSRPGLGSKGKGKGKKGGMREEARNTKVGFRKGVQYRKMPIEFVKSNQVYDPSKLVNGFRDMQLEPEPERDGEDEEDDEDESMMEVTETEGTGHEAEDENENENENESEPSFYIDVQGDDSLLEEQAKFAKPEITRYKKEEEFRVSESEAEIVPRKQVRIEESVVFSHPVEDGNTTAGIADDELSEAKLDSEVDILEEDLIAMQKFAMREIGDYDGVPSSSTTAENTLIDAIINTRASEDGVEYLVEWKNGLQSWTHADDLMQEFVDQGYEEDNAAQIIKQLGGLEASDDEVYGDYEGYDIDDYDEEESGDDGEESEDLDDVIAALIENDSSSRRGKQRQAAIMESYSEAANNEVPAQKWRGKGKNKVPDFQVNDEEMQDFLALQWQKSRASKAEKKRQREIDRKEGRLSRFYKRSGEIALADLFSTAMTHEQVVQQTFMFMENEGQTTLTFPPMSGENRSHLQEIGLLFGFKFKTVGNERGHRCAAFIKKETTLLPDQNELNQLKADKGFFPRSDIKMPTGKMKGLNFRDAARAKSHNSRAKHREGDIVGDRASAIQSDNIGRQMLEKMGWSFGQGLGVEKAGIIEPLTAKVKMTKKGLGKDFEF